MKIIDYKEGDDLTKILEISKYDPQLTEEQKIIEDKKSKSKILKFFMGFAWFRWVYFKLTTVEKGWPKWISRTDEERIQTCAGIFIRNIFKFWYVTEKIDGQSATFFYHKVRRWGFPSWMFGVCSRNIWLKKKDNSNYWKIAEKLNLEHIFSEFNKELVLQGEIAGPAIQKNKYGLKEIDLFVFNVIIDGKKCSVEEMEKFCFEFGFKTVPILYRSLDSNLMFGNLIEVKDVVQALVKFSTARSLMADIPREGIVVRLIDNPNVSFKAINPEFLLKFGE